MSRNVAPLAAITTIAVLLVAGATTSIILALRARTAEKTVASQLDEVKFQRNQAITANQRADSEAGKLKRELSEHYVDEGVAAWQKENPAVAMLWFVKALQLDSGDPQREHLQRIRIGTSLARSPRLLNVPAPPINHANIHGGRRLYAPYATVQILDIYGKPVIDPIATGQPVRFVSFSPSGKLIVAVTTDNTARVYDAYTGKPICSPLWHRDEIRHAAFSLDDKLLVTSSTDASARIWDVASGKPVTEPLNIDAAAYFGTFSPNSKMMIICADDNTAQLWEGSYFHTYLHHDQRVEHAEFSPDNTLVATASRDKFARVWEVSTYSAFPALLHQAAVSKVHFSPDNQRLLTAAQDNTARIWDVASGEPITPPLEHPLPVSHLAFSADGRYAFTVDSRDTVRVWDATPSTTFSDAHLDWADDPTISPDGKRLVTTSGTTARLWNIAAARPIGEAMEHEDSIQHAAFSPDGNLLVTASADNYARVWNAHTGKPIRQFRHKSTVLTAAFSPDSRCVISADNEGTIDIWNARSGESVLPKPIQHRIATHAVFSPDGRRVATASNMTARLWDARTGASVGASMEHSGLIYHVAFNPSSTKLITTSEDNSARIWDAASGNPLTPPMPHDSDVYTAIFSHDGKYAVTGTVPGETIVWDASTGKPLTPSLDDREFAHRTAPGPDESVILGGADGSPPLWTVRSTSIAPQKLEQIAQLLSAQRLDETGTLVRLSPNEWRDLWNSLRQEFPAYFAPPPPGGQSPSFAAFKQWAEKNIKADDINVEEESSSRIVFENLFPRFWLNSVHSSIGQLTRQIEGHATINKVDPGLAKLHAERANNFGRLGRFREASADLAKAIALDPGTDHFDYFRQAILLAYLGDTEGYIKHCRSMVARFKGQPAREVADRTAKACLLLPDVVPADPAIINQLVDRALGLGPGANLLHWFEMTKGIAEYRGGRPEHAAGWLARATTGLGNVGEPLSLMFMAMCEKKLGHEGAARKLLAEATVHLDKKQPKPGREDLTEFYHDWVVNQLIRREAEMLILGKTTVPRP
jgi:WD40 repeat protein/tetratricopeptide (TPR) repeat protein